MTLARIVTLVGGPHDGERVPYRGPVLVFPVPVRAAAVMSDAEALDTTAIVRTRCHVYRGPARHPDRAGVAMLYAGVEER